MGKLEGATNYNNIEDNSIENQAYELSALPRAGVHCNQGGVASL